MLKKIFALFLPLLVLVFAATSCKKSTSKSPTGSYNVPHALSNQFYIRTLLDTTWQYVGNDNADECQSSGNVCSDFLIYGTNYNLWTAQITLTDSAHGSPQDSVILGWVGKTFVTATDTAASHAYLFSFNYPDTIGRTLSSEYIINNTGARLTIDSVVYDGVSAEGNVDSLGVPAKSFRIKGTLSCKVTHFGDSVIHNVTQGVYSINVIEAK